MKSMHFVIVLAALFIFRLAAYAQYINPGMVLTFDDYSVTQWHKLLPMFEKYNAKATFFLTKPYALSPAQQQMLADLHEAGNEIACHGFHHYNALNFLDTSDLEQYLKQEILPSIHWFDSVLHIPVQTFAYPYGARNQQLDSMLLQHFSVIRGTSYQIFASVNKITRLTHSGLVFGVGVDKSYGHSMSSVEQALQSCLENKCIQVFYSHTPVDSVVKDYQIGYSTLDSILAFANENKLAFYTINETRLPVPAIPQGDTLVILPQLSGNFETSESVLDYNWNITPPEAGVLSTNRHEATAFWNEDYSGIAKLSVAHLNACGQGDFSSGLKVRVQQPVSVPESTTAFTIYPNPSKGNFRIHLANYGQIETIEVLDMQGRLVIRRSGIEKQSPFEIREKGLYLVRISFPTKSTSNLLVVE